MEEKNRKKIVVPLIAILIVVVGAWLFILVGGFGNLITAENLLIAKRNLLLPSILFFIAAAILLSIWLLPKKIKNYDKFLQIIFISLILITVFDLFRFGWKFTPFVTKKYLYPNTKALNFLKENAGNYRIMEADDIVFPPNFSIMYKLQSLDGYDPLYLLRYGELMAAVGRGEPNISSPFGFNRIINPQNYKSDVTDLLGVKYVLSAHEITEPTLNKVFQEGSTIIYENSRVADRAFFVGRTINSANKRQTIALMFDKNFPLKQRSVVEGVGKSFARAWSVGKANITRYSENKIEIGTQNEEDGFLVLSDTFYPTWVATVDGRETKIYLTDYNFRGIIVPKGEHKIVFYDKLF